MKDIMRRNKSHDKDKEMNISTQHPQEKNIQIQYSSENQMKSQDVEEKDQQSQDLSGVKSIVSKGIRMIRSLMEFPINLLVSEKSIISNESKTRAQKNQKNDEQGTTKFNLKLYPHIEKNPQFLNRERVIVIMVIGASGSGKTALLENMVNYLEGVNMFSNFRYVLAPNDNDQDIFQNHPTINVTTYFIQGHSNNTNFSMNSHNEPMSYLLIDTPGLEDNSNKIYEFVRSKIGYINYFCLVSKGNELKLTSALHSSISSALQSFGSEEIGKVVNLITYCDSDEIEPPVLQCLQTFNIPSNYFKFNNNLYLIPEFSVREEQWQMNQKSFKGFFELGLKPRVVQINRVLIGINQKIDILKRCLVQDSNKLNSICKQLQEQKEEREYQKQFCDYNSRCNFMKQIKIEKQSCAEIIDYDQTNQQIYTNQQQPNVQQTDSSKLINKPKDKNDYLEIRYSIIQDAKQLKQCIEQYNIFAFQPYPHTYSQLIDDILLEKKNQYEEKVLQFFKQLI